MGFIAANLASIKSQAHVVVIEVDTATAQDAHIVGNLGAVLDGDLRAILTHVDTATVAFGMVIDDFSVVESKLRVVAMHGNSAAMPVARSPLIGNVAGNRHIIELRSSVASLQSYAAGTIMVIASAASDKTAFDNRAAATVIVPPTSFISGAAFMLYICFLVCTTVNDELALDAKDLAVARAPPCVTAFSARQIAIDHMAMQVKGEGLAFGDLDHL